MSEGIRLKNNSHHGFIFALIFDLMHCQEWGIYQGSNQGSGGKYSLTFHEFFLIMDNFTGSLSKLLARKLRKIIQLKNNSVDIFQETIFFKNRSIMMRNCFNIKN